ncbi:MAG: MFS transporter [Steroidobacteraceae bacterium]|nr:MFS transporter [Pseudomonadales bacterium]MCP5472355.1 MFS transporter [Nevskiaceae bacterium]
MNQQDPPSASSAWSAVFAISLSVAALITAELLPASLLTPMARDLGVSEGVAGQSVTVTALAALFASLFTSRITRGIDRRIVVLSFSLLLTVSSLMVAFAPGIVVLLIGRALLGIGLGGFWAMAASLAMRLVPQHRVARALSIIFGGVSVAMVIAAPVGTLLGEAIGWRGVFIATAVLGAVCWLWQLRARPSMTDASGRSQAVLWALFVRPGVTAAMFAIFCVFAGQFAFFTYMRPFYESVTGLDATGFSVLLLAFGAANFLGTSLSAPLLNANLKRALAVAPLVLSLCAGSLLMFGAQPSIAAAATVVWGLAFGVIPVGWSTWVTRTLGDEAESAGGLQVAVIQLANTAGASLGGVAFEMAGSLAPLVIACTLLFVTAVIVGARMQAEHRQMQPHAIGPALSLTQGDSRC